VREAIEVKVLRRNGVALSCRGPGFIVANGPLGDAVASAAGSLDITATTEVLLAPLLCIAKVIRGTTEAKMG
jgi:hypothetical protein